MKVQIFATPNLVMNNEIDNKAIERYKQEIDNLKSIIQSLMKMNNNNEDNNSKINNNNNNNNNMLTIIITSIQLIDGDKVTINKVFVLPPLIINN